MKKILLSMAAVFLTLGAMAQSTLEFTFNRSANTVTAKLDGEAKEGIRATIAINPNTYLSSGHCANDSILAINRNTNAATADDPNCYTLTISGLGNCTFTGITVGGVAVNSSGQFQGMDTNRDRNFVIGYGADANNLTSTTPLTKRICDNAHCNGKPTDHTFTVEGTASGNLVIKVQIYTDGGAGCFYGLTSISLNNLIIIPEPTFANSYTLTQVTASDLMNKTTATRIAIQNVAFNNHNWLDIKATAGNNCPAEYSEDVVFIWEPVEAGVAGSYRIKDNDGNYLQNDASGQAITLGTIDNAAVFTAVEPEFSYDNASRVFSENEQDKLVRFKKADNCWINTQQPNELAKYNAGTGTFTIHFAYELTEVDKFTADFTKAEYASFYAPCSVTIPNGVEAYYLTSNGITSNKASLTMIENGIIPALTAVILKSNSNNVVDLNATEETSDEDLSANLFKGTVVKRYIQVEEVNGAYVLGIGDEGVGLYKSATTTINNQHNIYIFLNNANKAYLPASAVPATANNATSFSFRFEGEGTTGVEEVKTENGNVKTVYDLTGRRVEAITAPGIYIVNGKKVLVK